MFNIIEAKEKDGSKFRVIINSDASDIIRNINAAKIAIIIIDSTKLNDDDSWDEIEDYFQSTLEKTGDVVFVTRIVREKSCELYYYIGNNVDIQNILSINSNWNHEIQIINDEKQMVYEEMNNSKFLTSDEVSTIIELPKLFEIWQENNIDTKKEFPVMFSFYSAFKDETKKFVQDLESLNYNVESKTKRTLIIFKGYVTNVEKKQIWTIDKLKAEFTTLLFKAKNNENVHEGIFARE